MADPKEYPVEPTQSDDPAAAVPSPLDPDVTIADDPSPSPDGGSPQHPVHDSDLDDQTPDDFEEQSSPDSPLLDLPGPERE
jgi:hypothetical protein